MAHKTRASAATEQVQASPTGASTDVEVAAVAPASESGTGKGYVIIAIVYLLGIFIGALDTGIVTPARTVIQNEMGVDNALGIWMITIYTLAYAASIPVMGKLADRHGRKYIYLLSVALFGTGSLFCGLAQQFDSFTVLLVARAVQAFGGGGIMPVATAEFGTAFPPEKRGMALGLVGAVYGVANVLGASVGSAILDIFGAHNWPFIFFLNIPISLFIIIAGLKCLPNAKHETPQKIDGLGICVLTVMTLCLMYGLKNLDFFDPLVSVQSSDVYPFLIAALVALPLFIVVERRAADPVMNLSYFKNRDIVVTLLIGIITGIVLMGMVFIPQFSENALHLKAGDGGYLVVVLALFSGIGAPMSGKMIDRFGVKVVLGGGLLFSMIGALYLAFITCADPTWFNVIVCLIIMGFGMGFTMGTPINYMMLEKTDTHEANSALATLSLVRSIGTAVAPAIMVAFIAHAGTLVQDRIMDELPTQVSTAPLPYAQELDAEFAKLAVDENTADMMAGIDIPNLEDMQTIDINMNADDSTYTVPDDLTQMMQDADVTTIVDDTKTFASTMFGQMAPDLTADIVNGIEQGKAGMATARASMDANIVDMQNAQVDLSNGIDEMTDAISQQQDALAQMQEFLPTLEQVENYTSVLDFIPDSAKASMPQTALDMLADVRTSADLQTKINQANAAADALTTKVAQTKAAQTAARKTAPAQAAGMQAGIDQMTAAITAQRQAAAMMQQYLPTLQKMENYSSVVDLIPESALASIPQTALDQLADVRTVADMNAKIAELQNAIQEVTDAREEMIQARDDLGEGIQGIQDGQAELDTTTAQLNTVEAAIPSTFEEARQNYLGEIDERGGMIEDTFQSTINDGFKGMFLLLAICSGAGFLLLLLYRDAKRAPAE